MKDRRQWLDCPFCGLIELPGARGKGRKAALREAGRHEATHGGAMTAFLEGRKLEVPT